MRRPAALAPLTAVLILLTATPSFAEPPIPVDLTAITSFQPIGRGSVEFFYDAPSDTIRVQLDGDVSGATRTAGTWSLAIAGTRGGVPFTEPTWTSPALTITDHKVYVPRLTTVGEFTVDWAYTGVGGYIVVHLVHQVAWTTPTHNITAGSGVAQ